MTQIIKNYLKEISIVLLEICILYILPLLFNSDNGIGIVLLMLVLTFALSAVLACISNKKIKYLFPILVSILFIPTVYIYYNETAMIHSLWHLIASLLGMIIGEVIMLITKKVTK